MHNYVKDNFWKKKTRNLIGKKIVNNNEVILNMWQQNLIRMHASASKKTFYKDLNACDPVSENKI